MTSANDTYQPSKTVLQASRTNIGRLFRSIVEQDPAAIAIIEHDKKITYGELNDRVNGAGIKDKTDLADLLASIKGAQTFMNKTPKEQL